MLYRPSRIRGIFEADFSDRLKNWTWTHYSSLHMDVTAGPCAALSATEARTRSRWPSADRLDSRVSNGSNMPEVVLEVLPLRCDRHIVNDQTRPIRRGRVPLDKDLAAVQNAPIQRLYGNLGMG